MKIRIDSRHVVVRWIRPTAFILFISFNSIGWTVEAPTIRLFPTTVLEEIRHTGSIAKEMETGLQEIVSRLDQQQQLFMESKCEGAEEDPGCAQITKQLGATYLEMLKAMDDQLPDMEQAVQSTRVSLQKRLRRELGQRMTPWGLQEELLRSNRHETGQKDRPALRGRSGMRLSDRFNQYYKLVANSANNRSSSLAVVASDIYLDMEETAELIARTRDEIGRATLTEQLHQSFGAITPEMQAVVAGVKSILFGDPLTEVPLAGPPPGSSPTTYTSPLAL